ncbi:amino acid permease, partial [Candidatus Woesearchaeota archaeon]|nr:amino acid permease [Candidatus Woesearchaeota archaeon]
IIVIAHTVTLATAFSISAIATNIKVRGGGLYYLISRSLGSEFGGSIGIQLFLAQTIASSFYSIAFARGIGSILSSYGIFLHESHIALISMAIFGIIVLVGAHFVVKIQYIIFGAIILSLLSIFMAPNTQPLTSVMFTTPLIPFWVAFAMYFPAVTGIDAGVGMSGELKNPRKSLVKGTFIAIIITMLIYIGMAFKYAISAPASELFSNPHVVQSIALLPEFVLIGVVMATSSSALSCLMTAPRCLSAMVEDRIFPRWFNIFGKKHGKNLEPRMAVFFSLLIAITIILLGDLYFVSKVVSIFFLSVYGWINGAAFFEKISQNPSYRPLFNAPAIISLYGVIAAYTVMYLFSLKVLIIVVVIQAAIFYLLLRSKKSMKFEGVWEGVFFQLLRLLIKRIDLSEKSKKNWRPTILAFCANDLNKTAIASLLHWIGSRRSIIKLYFLKKGDVKSDAEERKKLEASLLSYVDEYKLDIFPKILMADNFEDTISALMQSEAIGNLPFNTVLIDYDKQIKIDKLMNEMVVLKKNVLVLRNQSGFSDFRKVDVWWRSQKNGNLMLLLAYLVTHSNKWLEADSIIRVFKIIDANQNSEDDERQLRSLIEESRIENVKLHFIRGREDDVKKIINAKSENADLVFIGIPELSKFKSGNEIIGEINEYTEKLKVSIVVMAHNKIDFSVN